MPTQITPSYRRRKGIVPLLALLLLSLLVTEAEAQSNENATRLPDGEQPEFWEQPLSFTRTYYVNGAAANASDEGPGTEQQPFSTISRAAELLQPGERVVIASGVYRENVRPARGGTGPDRMISYEAAPGAEVIIKGSVELREGWRPSGGGGGGGGGGGAASGVRIYQIDLDPRLFIGYNPFLAMNMPSQRWQYMNRMNMNVHNVLVPYTRRRGMLFIDGKPAEQMRVRSELIQRDPSWADPRRGQPYSAELFQEIGAGGKFYISDDGLQLQVRLPDDGNPADHVVEITTYERVFAPAESGLGYIRVKGLTFQHAGNGFPFPQRGLVSASQGHHWIIEDNVIEWANSVCMDIGGGQGSHIVRRNTVRYCGIGGLQGNGAPNLLVEDNLFEWIGWQDAEHMSESAGVKFHRAVNLLFSRNVIRHMRNAPGIWLDVGIVNSRVTRNVFADIYSVHGAMWVEASHAQNQVDNNIVSDVRAAEDKTIEGVETGGASGIYVLGTDSLIVAQNLFSDIDGACIHVRMEEERLIGARGGTTRGERVFNNMFHACGGAAIELANEFNVTDGNVFAGLGGGYLSILYPGRRERLDVDTWRDFYGWEKAGQVRQLDASLDPESLRLSIVPRATIEPVGIFNNITSDFFGRSTGNRRLPGPFSNLSETTAVNVDPRQGE